MRFGDRRIAARLVISLDPLLHSTPSHCNLAVFCACLLLRRRLSLHLATPDLGPF